MTHVPAGEMIARERRSPFQIGVFALLVLIITVQEVRQLAALRLYVADSRAGLDWTVPIAVWIILPYVLVIRLVSLPLARSDSSKLKRALLWTLAIVISGVPADALPFWVHLALRHR